MSHFNRSGLLGAVLLAALLCSAMTLSAADVCVVPAGSVPAVAPSGQSALAQADFNGTVRIYIVEPTARWKDYSGAGYHFGFINFALDTAIALTNGERVHLSRVWDASASGFGGFSESNIMAIAVISQQDSVLAYSNPPDSSPFYAHYADGAAYARPGECDSNNTSGNSTHTVFLEEATATWCPYCPAPNYYLANLYEVGNYNFIYAALVRDKDSVYVDPRFADYNVRGLPTVYGDGGDSLLVGGYSGNSPYLNVINACASRPTSGANIMIKVGWLGGGDLQLDLVYAFGAPLNTVTDPVAPSGDVKPMINESYNYTATSIDAEGDQLWYQFDWGDQQISEWLGPYNSGDPCTAAHTFADLGPYDVKVKTRDYWGGESNWSPALTVNPSCCVTRGDLDHTGNVNVADVTYLVASLFRNGPGAVCAEEGDVDGSGTLNVSDLTYLVAYVFKGGTIPPSCS